MLLDIDRIGRRPAPEGQRAPPKSLSASFHRGCSRRYRLVLMGEQQFDVVIVGAGFGGIGAAIQLSSLGYQNIVILDREDALGGTWHVNHYPGLSVDQPSPTFSYRFEPNPYWSRMYAPGAELKHYAV